MTILIISQNQINETRACLDAIANCVTWITYPKNNSCNVHPHNIFPSY
ncbi:MAG: hypothetical protein IJN54_03390 [Lachnospiraceae bacterium]|nr:hypothetical protein [Lachnospiraceae bacterium]